MQKNALVVKEGMRYLFIQVFMGGILRISEYDLLRSQLKEFNFKKGKLLCQQY